MVPCFVTDAVNSRYSRTDELYARIFGSVLHSHRYGFLFMVVGMCVHDVFVEAASGATEVPESVVLFFTPVRLNFLRDRLLTNVLMDDLVYSHVAWSSG